MEVIRYAQLGKEDTNYGIGSFEVRLADGRVVSLSKVDIGALLNDASISTQALSLVSLILSGALTVSGNVTIVGSLSLGAGSISGTLALAGGQIAFPAPQLPSADSRTLDDYNEGSFLPSVGGNATYVTQTGRFVKVGKVVFIKVHVHINVLGTGSTNTFSGLPYTVASGVDGCLTVSEFQSLGTSVVLLSARADTSGTTVTLRNLTAAGATVTSSALLQNGSIVEFGGFYFV